jgi:hypothetical protein
VSRDRPFCLAQGSRRSHGRRVLWPLAPNPAGTGAPRH